MADYDIIVGTTRPCKCDTQGVVYGEGVRYQYANVARRRRYMLYWQRDDVHYAYGRRNRADLRYSVARSCAISDWVTIDPQRG